MVRYAKAFAWMNGRDKVEKADFMAVAPYLLWHKVQPSEKAITENPKYSRIPITPDLRIIGKVISKITV